MNIHAVAATQNLLVLFLMARWTDYEAEETPDGRVRYRPRGSPYWDEMAENDGSGDYPYYYGLAQKWDADGRPDNAKDYW